MNNLINKTTTRIGLNLQSRRARVVFTLSAVGAYILAFIPLYPLIGSGVTALSVFPVIVAGWLFGLRIGLLAGLLSSLLNTLLLNLAGQEPGGWGVVLYSGGVPETIVTVLTGVIVGRLRDLSHQLKRQLAEREQTEARLRQSEEDYHQLMITEREQRLLAETLGRLGLALNSTLELSELLSLICQESINFFEVGSAFVWLVQGDELVGYTGHGQGQEKFPGIRLSLSDSESLAPLVVREMRPIFVNEAAKSDIVNQKLSKIFRGKAMMGVPLIKEDTAIGVLMIMDTHQAQRFSQADVEKAVALGNQAAIAVQNAQLFEAEKEQRELAEALREVGIALNTTLELAELFDRLLDQIARVVPYDSANFTLVEGGRTRITRMRGYEQFGEQIADDIANISFDISAIPHLRSMAQTGQPMVISDTAVDPNWVIFDTPIVIRSWAGAPMMLQGQMIAFLSLDKIESGFYGPEHAERLAMFANQATLALENAQLFEAETRRRREAEMLHQSSTALISTLDLQGVLDSILTQLEQVVSYDSACVFLHQEDKLRAVSAKGFANLDQIVGQAYPTDDALFEELRRTKQPLLLPDAQVDPRFQQWGNSGHIHGWMAVPMIVQQKIIGYLTLDSRQVDAYNQADTTLVQTFANQAAVAIVNTQLFEQTQVALAQSEALYQATRTLITLTNLPEMLQSLVDRVAEMLPANRVSLYTVDMHARQIIQVVTGGPGADRFIPLTFDELWGGLTGWTLRKLEPVISPKGQRDPRHHPVMHQRRIDNKTGAIIAVPWRYRDDVLGAMIAVNRIDEPDFMQHDVELMMAIANQAAIAIENARLFEITQEARQLSDALREIEASLTATLDLEEVLNRILDGLGKVVPYASASLMLAEDSTLRMQAARGLPEGSPAWSHTFTIDQNRVDHEIYKTKKPLIIPDVHQDPDFVEIEGTEYIRSWLGVPLIVRDQVIGILNVDQDQPNFYTEEHAAIASTFAHQAAIALENARLFDETFRGAQQLAILNELAGEMTGILEVQELCATVAERLYSVFNFYNVAIFLADLEAKELIIQTNLGASVHIAHPGEYRRAIGKGIIGQAAKTLETIVVNDTRQHPDFLKLEGMNVRSQIAIPLKVGKQLIGVLNVDSDELNTFNESNIAALKTIADQLAVALEKARLFAETQQWAEHLETLRQASLSLISSLELQPVLETILKSAFSLMTEVDNLNLFLYQSDTLTFGAALSKAGREDKPFANPRKDGITYTVARQGKSIVVSNIRTHPLFANAPSDWVGAIIGLPLKIGQRVVGVMNAASRQPRTWLEVELHALELLADQAALAIENARLFEAEYIAREQAETLREETRQNLTLIMRLYELSTEFASSLSLEDAANLVIEKVVQATDAHSAVINLLDENGNFEQAFGPDEATPRPSGTTMTIVKTGQPLVISDTRQKSELLHLNVADKEIRASIGLPLKAREQTIGVLFVRYAQPHKFSDREMETLFIFANQAAITIQNAQLYEKVQQHTAQLEARVAERTFKLQTLYELAQTLSHATQLSEVVRLTLLHLYQVSHDVAASLLLTDTTHILVIQSQHVLTPQVETQIQEKLLETIAPLTNQVVDEKTLEVHLIQPKIEDDLRPPLENLGSVMTAPILMGEMGVGLLLVATEQEFQFNEELKQLLYIVANQAADTLGRLHSLLAAEHQRLENLVAHLPSGIIMLNAEQQVVLANPLAQKLMGMLTTTQVGDRLTQLGEYSIETILESVATDTPLTIATEGLPSQLFEVTAEPITTGLEAGGWTLVIRDVTEERGIQKQIQQQERMAAVGQLAAGIAHDFNNILTGIIGYAELLSLDPNLSPSAKGDVERISKQGQRAAHLVRQILDFSRQTISAKQPLNLLSVIQETIRLLERIIREDIHISLEAEPDDYTISGDLIQVQQALTNLAVNARDAMPTGGTLKLQLTRFVLQPGDEPPCADLSPGDWIAMVISDTGIGIPPELHQQIFEPFFTTKEVGEGTGLGLAQVYGIMRQHDGYIDVRSQPKVGTTFSLYFPTLASPGVSAQEAHAELPRGNKELILLVEDDSSVLAITTNMLQHLGYRVLTATNGHEALEVYDEHQNEIALVLTDITMPQMGGTELTLTLRERNPAIKVVALTGYPLESSGKDALTKGIVDWLQKPLNIKDLAYTVSRSLNNIEEETS